MYTKLRYVGTDRKRLTWNSMGECFVYVVEPGEVIDVPASQVNNAKAIGPLVEVDAKKKSKKRPHLPVQKVQKIFETETTEVITSEDEDVFKKQDKLNPFKKYEKTDDRLIIEDDGEDEEDTEDVSEEQDAKEEDGEVSFETEEKESNTDFAPFNKTELSNWLIEHGVDESHYKLMQNRKDTLISMCVNIEKSL